MSGIVRLVAAEAGTLPLPSVRRSRKPLAIRLLRWVSHLLAGDHLKTTFYLYAIAKPRNMLRLLLNRFYRMEHVYDVLREARTRYRGRFSILEFGTNEGYAFVKMLYATKYMGMTDRVTVHGFDTFEGMPQSDDERNKNIIYGDREWAAGQFRGKHAVLDEHCRARYENYRLHRGLFADSLTDEFLKTLRNEPPILVWIDCDFYTSARSVMERLIPYLPNGCVVYFDEYEFNYGSRFTGEARLVHEINHGELGDTVELVLDGRLSLDSKRVYRFLRFPNAVHFRSRQRRVPVENDPGRSPTNASPLP